MADYTKTITNSIRAFGIGYSTKWGQALAFQTMTWGTSKWGEGTTPIAFVVEKVISESVSPTWEKTEANVSKVISESVTTTYEMSVERLISNGWYVVFTSSTIDAEDRDFASWTSATIPDVTFTCQAAGSTTWSEV